jgi:hypothetical protein
MTMLGAIRKAVEADPIGGSALIDEVVYSYLADQAEELRPEIEQLLSSFMQERVLVAKRALGRSYVESVVEGDYPSEDIQKSAQWIAGLEMFIHDSLVQKDDLEGSDLYAFNRKHPRGAGGRFRRGIAPYNKEKGHPTTTRRMEQISPNLRNDSVLDDPEKEGRIISPYADKDVVQQEQHQYEEANKVVNSMLRNFSGKSLDDINVIVNLTDGNNGNRYSRSYSAKSIKQAGGFDMDDPSKLWTVGDIINDFELEAKSGAPDVVQNQINAYNTLGNTGNAAVASLATVDPDRLKALGGAFNYGDSQKNTKLGNFFNRLGVGGSVMQQVPGMEKYGDYARFVGTMGPQAEDALGPYVQQAAYRYRGTEKEPDLELIRQFNSKTMRAVDAAAESRTKMSDISDTIMNAASDRANQSDITLQAASHQINNLSRTRGGAFTPDELSLNVRADVAAHHMLQTLPDDPFIARVSAKSGNILPSQGVIIDADGDVVSQSVGFSDDHYLPFDLKNLKSLRGGQYVRTRQQGGLTGEDIYASIRSGTRMATVVSSSGVYSIEFDPNFRGARANSDKARSMYDRYLKILDAVDKSGLYVQDISSAEKAQLRAQAQSMGDKDDVIFDRFLEERRQASQSLDSGTIAILQEEATAQVDSEGFKQKGDRYNRRVEEVFEELADEKLKERVSQLSLNAKGYDVALRTLQQQFPYFIRNVSYQPLTSKQEGEGFLQSLNQSGKLGARQTLGAKDEGYVNPGGLRPEKMRQGFYAPSRQSYNKFKNEDYYGGGSNEEVVEEKTTGKKAVATGGAKGAVAPKSAFLARVEAYSSGQKDKGLKAIKQLDILLNTIPADAAIGDVDKSITWNDVKDLDDAAALKWLLHPGNGGFTKPFESDPDRVTSLLSNKKLVDETLGMYKTSAESGHGLGSFGDLETMSNKIVEAGKIASMSNSFSNPFADEIAGDEGYFYAGAKPMAIKDLALVSDSSSINALLEKNPGVANAFNDLKSIDEGAIPTTLKEYFKIIADVKKAHDSVLSLAAADAETAKKTYTVDEVLRQAGVSEDEWKKAIGNLNDLVPYGYNSTLPMSQFKDYVIKQRARNLQDARTLLTADRLMSAMSGGEEPPKAPAPVEPSLEPTAKNLSKDYWSQQDPSFQSLSKGRLSPRVQVLSKSHPLTREIQMRKSLNLPLVSRKQK